MAAALNAWAIQANAQVFVDPGPVAHLRAPAVKGTLTPRQALRALLAHSNLQVAQGADGVFLIKPRLVVAAAPMQAAPTIAVAAPVTVAPPAPLTTRTREGPWVVGLAAQFAPDTGSATGGASAAIHGEYFVTDHLATALAVTAPRTHSFDDGGSARLLSSTLRLKYYFAPEQPLDPFVGAGINIAALYDTNGVARLDRATVGPTFGAGLDFSISPRWLVTGTVSWAQVRPDAGPGQQIRIDPVQFDLGIAYRFGAFDDSHNLKRR